MASFPRVIYWLGVAMLAALAVLAVLGAFLGPLAGRGEPSGVGGLGSRAAELFNSLPLAVYWFVLAGVLLAGAAAMLGRRRQPMLALMHLAGAVVIVAGMLGSAGGHRLIERLGGPAKVREGFVVLREAQTSQAAHTLEGTKPLPFAIHLDRFTVDYHPQGMPRQYTSDVTILRDGQSPRPASIRVNRPMHCGGYYLYQNSCGLDAHTGLPYTVLLVKSDTGVLGAMVGLGLLAAATVGHFWLIPLGRRWRHRR